jgi:hypothetical protein
MLEGVDGCPTFASAYVGRKRRGEALPSLLLTVVFYGGSTNILEDRQRPAPAQARSSLGDQ